MLVACQPDDVVGPSAMRVPKGPLSSVLDGDFGILAVSSITNPAASATLTTYPHRTAVSVLLSGTISISSNPEGSYYSDYSGGLDGSGIFVHGVYYSCYAYVAIAYNATFRPPGLCATWPTPRPEWADTIIVSGEGSIFRTGGIPLTTTEGQSGCGPNGGEICYAYSGSQTYTIRRVPAELALAGPPVVQPGTSITAEGTVSPQWVAAKKIPFVVQRWRWFRGDSMPPNPYPPNLTNPSGCTPPAVDTNPAPCTVTSDKSGVLEIDAIVNGVPETLRKNISVVAGGRVCEGQVLKEWGRISSRYQANEALRKGKPHRGRDAAGELDTPVYAAEAGVVVDTTTGRGSGIRVIVRGNHNSYYFHLSSKAPGMRVGLSVAAGQLLGYVGSTGEGSTGPHLHFQQHTPGPLWHGKFAPADTEVDPCYF